MCTMAEGAGRLKGFLCAHIGHSSTRHVCSFVARDTEHFLTFSFFYLSCVVVVFFSQPRPVVHVSNYPLRRSTAGWLLRNTPPPQVMSPKGIELNRILVKPQNQITDDQDGIEEPCVKKLSYSLSVYDSAESTATPPDSDLEDEQLRKLLASPLHRREREENEGQPRAYHPERESLMVRSSRNPEVSGKTDAECVQKRRENAQRTQAYHSRRESLMASSSRELEVSGKTEVTNRETW